MVTVLVAVCDAATVCVCVPPEGTAGADGDEGASTGDEPALLLEDGAAGGGLDA